MKKIKFLFTLCAACILLASCSDVPMPYIDPKKDDPSNVKKLPYTSSSLSTDWTMVYETNNPWSQGGTYTQATGYQKWDGSETKSNKEVKGYLVSPAICTKTDSNAVYFMFDYTIKYTNNVSGWEAYHKIYATTDLNSENRVEIPWTPESSPYSDWTLYPSGKISLPEQFVNQDSVFILFYFYAPENASTTWELENFEIGEGHGEVGPTPVGGSKTLPYESSNLNTDWTMQFLAGGNNPWSQGGTYTQATGYQKWDGSDTKSNKEVEGYLVSPPIKTVTDSSSVSFTFDYTIKYTNNVSGWEQYHKLYASTDPYDPSKYVELKWTPKSSPYTDWTLYPSDKITLPEQFMNKDSVYVLFYFYAPATGSTTWELEHFKIFAGSGSKPGPDPKPVGDNLIANGDFETWSGTTAVGWQSSTTASTAGAVSQSTDAHTGSYSAEVSGAAAANKRIAYKEITLAAGTYNIKFWAKSTGAKSSVNPGYVAVVDGKVNGSYQYTEYVDITNEWTEVSKSFTLAAQTTVNLVIMNSKNPGVNVLIDDYELTTADGGIIGGDTPPTPPAEEKTVSSTVADFISAPESTNVWYELTGTISNLKDADLYGNFDLTDATASVYVYGLLSAKGGQKKQFQELVTQYGLKDGSKITLRGNRGSYNGKVEVTNAYLVSVQ